MTEHLKLKQIKANQSLLPPF